MKKVKYKNLLFLFIIVFGIMFGCKLNVNATIVQPNVKSGIYFNHHNSFILDFWGEYGFCFQRGYPFRSEVSDLQMTKTEPELAYAMLLMGGLNPDVDRDEDGNVNTAAYLRAMTNVGGFPGLVQSSFGGDGQYPFFGGWGVWELNEDHTGLVLVSADGIPSSGLVDVDANGQHFLELF